MCPVAKSPGPTAALPGQAQKDDIGPCIARFDEAQQISVSASKTRFVLSHTKILYPWADIRPIAKRAWTAYASASRPAAVTSISLRLVNRLKFPASDGIALADYLNIVPRASPSLSPIVSGYAFEIRMPQPHEPGTLVIVRQATAPLDASDHHGSGAIILDLEVLRRIDEPQWDSETIWTAFDAAQRKATDVFEATITDRLRELIA